MSTLSHHERSKAVSRVSSTTNRMPRDITSEDGRCVLHRPSSEAEWTHYHDLRRAILYERRGRFGAYDASHPDEHRRENHPFLLLLDGIPAGTIRIDLVEDEAIFRLVTIRENLQRHGYGRQMLALAEKFVREEGRPLIRSHVHRTATGFYERCGFTRDGPDEGGETVLMGKDLAQTPS